MWAILTPQAVSNCWISQAQSEVVLVSHALWFNSHLSKSSLFWKKLPMRAHFSSRPNLCTRSVPLRSKTMSYCRKRKSFQVMSKWSPRCLDNSQRLSDIVTTKITKKQPDNFNNYLKQRLSLLITSLTMTNNIQQSSDYPSTISSLVPLPVKIYKSPAAVAVSESQQKIIIQFLIKWQSKEIFQGTWNLRLNANSLSSRSSDRKTVVDRWGKTKILSLTRQVKIIARHTLRISQECHQFCLLNSRYNVRTQPLMLCQALLMAARFLSLP